MKQTSNYQFNQWEKTDRILMEDFNRDNAKLEDALNALNKAIAAEAAFRTAALAQKTGWVDAGTFSTQVNSAAGELTLRTPGVNYGAFSLVVLEVTFPVTGYNWYIQPNDWGSMGVCNGSRRFFGLPMKNPDAPALFLPANGDIRDASSARCTFGELDHFTFGPEHAEYTIQGTASIRVLGLL